MNFSQLAQLLCLVLPLGFCARLRAAEPQPPRAFIATAELPSVRTSRANWMLEGKYGIFLHYQYRILLGYSIKTNPQFPNPSQMTAAEWNRFVDAFDVKGFAEQMAEAKVGWVLFCIDDHYFAWPCAPNKAFSEFTGYAPGEKCSRRDLIWDLADALNAKGVKLICYFAGLNGYMKEPKVSAGLMDAGRGGLNEKTPPSAECRKRRLAVLQEYADRYKDKIAGWWFDGIELDTYRDKPGDWESIEKIVRSANPDAVIAFSYGRNEQACIRKGMDDFTGGDTWSKQDLKRLTPARLPAQDRILWHGKIYCGNVYHGMGDANQFGDQELIDWIRTCNSQGGICTLDWPFDPKTGLLKDFGFAQLKRVAKGVRAADNLALPARATASESYGQLTPEKAIDGSMQTRWSGIPGHNAGVWYQLDWGKPTRIGEVIIHQFDRFTHELDVQVWDADKNNWRTIQHFGTRNKRLPLVVLCRFSPVETTRLRIGNITNGPSFNEVEVYAQAFSAYEPVVRLGSDLQGGFFGVVTDPWGTAPIEGAELVLSGTSSVGPWQQTAKRDEHGLCSAPMPLGMTGEVTARVTAGGRTWTTRLDATQFQYGLTPISANKRSVSLNGKWRFAIDPPEGFWRPDFDDSRWAQINVPAHWEMEGFKGGTKEIGGYRTQFALPAGEGRVKLRFDGVYSGAEVWVNGQRVAQHEGGATPFETDITDAVHDGQNVLTVRVREHTPTSDKLDKMSLYADFPLAGIMRKVTLFRVPQVHVGGLAITSKFSADYKDATLGGRVTVLNESGAAFRGKLACRLVDPDGKPVPLDVAPRDVEVSGWGKTDLSISLPVKAPRTWTAERPNLYVLAIELSGEGKISQQLTQRVGFRQTEIRGTEILINGRPVKFRGTCHHDSHPLLGRAVTPELERRDLELMKQANLNAVRTSHYPPLPELIDCADELGVYVEDEAPFCWVGDADDMTLWPRILQRTAELVARDRNHPSVFIWSLCNESEFGSGFQRSHDWVRREDPSRPTSAATSAWLEIATLHNPLAISRIDENEKLNKPLLFDESLAPYQGIFNDVSEMWIDPGIRDYYAQPLPAIYDRFMKSRVTQGSMIWCWGDDVFCVPNRGLEYGRQTTRCHFIENAYRIPGRGLTGDAPWGVVDGWRRPKPEFWIVKKLHSPVKIKEGPMGIPKRGQPIRIAVENQYDFTNLSQVRMAWRVGSQKGEVVAQLAARSAGVIEIAPPSAPKHGDVLRLDFFDPKGRLIDAYELPIGSAAPPVNKSVKYEPLVVTDENTLAGSGTRIIAQDFELLFDHGGYLRRCVAFGQAMLLEYPAIHVLPTRAPTSPLPSALAWRLKEMKIDRAGENVRVSMHGSYDSFDGVYDVTITPAGQIETKASFKYTGPDVLARETGLRFSVPRDCRLLKWDRNAEWSVYPETHIGRPRGQALAFAAHGDQLPPTWDWSQDNSPMGSNDFRSTKRNINSAAIGYDAGPSVVIESNGKQHLRAMVESDRISIHVNDFYGGTNVGWWEWVHNYGEGKLLKKGDVVESTLRLQLVKTP